MPQIGDPALASRPDLFELVTGGPIATIMRVAGCTSGAVILAVGIWGFASGNPVLGVIGLLMGIGSPICLWYVAGRVGMWHLRDGRMLQYSRQELKDDPGETWRRLATGDPAQYTPLAVSPAGEHSARTLQAYWPQDERVTYLVIVEDSGKDARATEIIELRDEQHDRFQAAKAQGLDTEFLDAA